MGSSSKKKRKENLLHVQEGRLVVFTNNSSVKRHWRQKKLALAPLRRQNAKLPTQKKGKEKHVHLVANRTVEVNCRDRSVYKWSRTRRHCKEIRPRPLAQ